jgi:phospholipid transport system substrate-binding protein
LKAFRGEGSALMEELRNMVDRVLAILNDPNLKPEAARAERRNQFRRLLYSRFDFSEMANRSLGLHWRRRTAEEQHEFVDVFTNLLEASYAGEIESYVGGKVIYAREIQEEEYGEVDTKVLTTTGEEISLNYKLHLTAGEWKVYDFVIGNVSIVNSYRSQFHRAITTTSYEELMRAIGQAKQIKQREKSNSRSEET